MAFKLKAGNTGNPMHKNYPSSFPKRTKTLGTRDDNTTMDNISVKGGINTLTTRKKDGTLVRTRDITAKRAARIKKRQARRADKKMRPDAEADVATAAADVAAGPDGDIEQQHQNIEDRIKRDFPPDFGTEGYDGPTYDELMARKEIMGVDPEYADVEPMKGEELAKYKAEQEAIMRAEIAAEKAAK